MKEIPLGRTSSQDFMPEERHLASAVGAAVVSTPALIGFLEQTSHHAILPYLEAGEASVGTRVEVDHLAAAHLGRPVVAAVRVAAVDRRRITFEVEARQDDRLIMQGRHVRAVISRERLAGNKPAA